LSLKFSSNFLDHPSKLLETPSFLLETPSNYPGHPSSEHETSAPELQNPYDEPEQSTFALESLVSTACGSGRVMLSE
jgi:hypothetical protein